MTEEDYDEFRLCEVIDAAAKIFAGTEKAACDAESQFFPISKRNIRPPRNTPGRKTTGMPYSATAATGSGLRW